ncbi:MAG: hypothetical protein V7K39_14525 [Nostoc sp.]
MTTHILHEFLPSKKAQSQHTRLCRQEQHFQPPAGNEVLKEFQLQLTPSVKQRLKLLLKKDYKNKIAI